MKRIFFLLCLISSLHLLAQDTANKSTLTFHVQKYPNTDTLDGLTFTFFCNNQDSTFMKIFVSDDDSSWLFWGNMIKPHFANVSDDKDVLTRLSRVLNKGFVESAQSCCSNGNTKPTCGYYVIRRENNKVLYLAIIDMQFVTKDMCGTDQLNILALDVKELCRRYIREGR